METFIEEADDQIEDAKFDRQNLIETHSNKHTNRKVLIRTILKWCYTIMWLAKVVILIESSFKKNHYLLSI